MLPLADWFRLVCVVESVPLALMCLTCMFGGAMKGDQRLRFASLALIGVVVVGGQIDAWGKPGTWRIPVLAVALGCAVVGCAQYLARRRRTDRE